MPASAKSQSSAVGVSAYRGDVKTLLAFDLTEQQATGLAGFTIHCQPPSGPAYHLHNALQFENPAAHAQVASESANSSVNAPFHKFRWLHVPGSVHQGPSPVYGTYAYGVTPRYFDGNGSMQPLDASRTASVEVAVGPLDDGPIELGFTRGYIQSQAFVNHFGLKALIRPHDDELLFDTSQQSGTNATGQRYSYLEEYVRDPVRERGPGAGRDEAGKFGRYAHDKVLIVADSTGARKALTESTNFSTTGLYVNANHVLVFPQREVASKYAELFETVWEADVGRTAYLRSPLSGETFSTPRAAPGPAITSPRIRTTSLPRSSTGSSRGSDRRAPRPTQSAACCSRSWTSATRIRCTTPSTRCARSRGRARRA
jgi:hypothetical protein